MGICLLYTGIVHPGVETHSPPWIVFWDLQCHGTPAGHRRPLRCGTGGAACRRSRCKEMSMLCALHYTYVQQRKSFMHDQTINLPYLCKLVAWWRPDPQAWFEWCVCIYSPNSQTFRWKISHAKTKFKCNLHKLWSDVVPWIESYSQN